MSTQIKTVDPNGNADYASLALWEAGEQNLYTAGTTAVADCRRTGPLKDTTLLTIAGWTAGVTPRIQVNQAHRHQGVVAEQRTDGAWIYHLYAARQDTGVINLENPLTQIDGLVVRNTFSGSGQAFGISTPTSGGSVVTDLRVENCLWGGGDNSGTNNAGFLRVLGPIVAGAVFVVRNNIVFGCKGGGGGAYFRGGPPSQVVYHVRAENNTFFAPNTTGYPLYIETMATGSTLVVQNNFLGGGVVAYGTTNMSASITLTQSNNVTSDNTAPGTPRVTGANLYANYFIDHINGNFHLRNTAQNLWGLSGANLSHLFTTDIDGQTRTNWDIGADEFVAVGGPTESLSSVLGSVTSAAARQNYLAAAHTLITAGAQVSAVRDMLEAVVSLGVSAGSAAAVQDYTALPNTTITGQTGAGASQGYRDQAGTTITEQAVAAAAQGYRDQGATVVVGSASTASQLIGVGAAETLLSVAQSAVSVGAAQAYVELLSSIAVSASSLGQAAGLVERVGTTAASIASAGNRQHFFQNLAIVALSTGSLREVGAYVERVASAASSQASLVDTLVGEFVGRYLAVHLAARRTFNHLAARRTFNHLAARRSRSIH